MSILLKPRENTGGVGKGFGFSKKGKIVSNLMLSCFI